MAVTDRGFNPSNHAGVDAVKAGALAFEAVIMANVPEGERRGVALLLIEAASMFAVKAFFVPQEAPSEGDDKA